VFSTTTVNLSNAASFSTAFTFNINNSGGICDSDGCGADGLVFAVQTTSNTAGGLGIGIGYSGLNHSLGVEFDTWDNGAQDLNDGNAVGIDLNGNVTSAVQQHVPVRMNNGDDWNAWIDYNGATHLLEVRLAEGIGAIRPVAAFLSYTVDLAATLGTTNAYVGFTSGTGSAWGNHDIVSWQFNDNYAPIGTPVPASLALLGIGLLGAAVARRRKAA
jgi:hypothetical protein